MEFRSCIKNECGEIVWWCDEHTHKENMEYLKKHPEWSLGCSEIVNQDSLEYDC